MDELDEISNENLKLLIETKDYFLSIERTN